MIHIDVGDIKSSVLKPRSHLKALALIRDVCRARPDGFQFMPKYKSHMWDGYISLMISMSSFPTGLLPFVAESLLLGGHDVQLIGQFEQLGKTIDPNCLNNINFIRTISNGYSFC